MPHARKKFDAFLFSFSLFLLLVVASVPAFASQDESFEQDAAGGAAGEKILAWVGPGTAPGRQGANSPGELVFINPDGTRESIMALENGTTRVVACGDGALSPDGSTFALFISQTAGGVELGSLYLMRDVNPNLEFVADELSPIACTGNSPFQFSPDSSRYAYIDYPQDIASASAPTGRLRINSTADNSEQGNFENVAAFDLSSNGAAFVSFFTNERGLATEVAFFTWDGSIDREIDALNADENCFYTSASAIVLPDGRIVSNLGYRCTTGETATQWRLYMIDPQARTVDLIAEEVSGVRFDILAASNSLFASPDGSRVFFTVPDGVNNQSVSLRRLDLASLQINTVVERFAIMPSLVDTPYDANNHIPVLSADGRWLAFVINDGNNDATLNVLDLNSDLPPITFSAGDRGDTIGEMVFSSAGDQLVVVAGTDQGGNNSLFALNLETGSETRIRRGRFAQGALSPDDSRIAVMQWIFFDDDEEPFLSLEIVDLNTSEQSVLFEGGEVVDGELMNQSFVFPLLWRS